MELFLEIWTISLRWSPDLVTKSQVQKAVPKRLMMVADAKKRQKGLDHLCLNSCTYGLIPRANLIPVKPKRFNMREFVEYSRYFSAFFAQGDSTNYDILFIYALFLGSISTDIPNTNSFVSNSFDFAYSFIKLQTQSNKKPKFPLEYLQIDR